MTRLFLWHFAQPVGYFIAFAINVPQLSGLQLSLATAVCAREGIYLLATAACVLICPSFLVVDVRGSVRDTHQDVGVGDNFTYENGFGFLMLYVLVPDKYVFGALFTSLFKFDGRAMLLVCIFSGIADFCGVAALSAGLVSQFLPPELAVGYGATALAGLCLLSSTLRANYRYDQDQRRQAAARGQVRSRCGYLQMQMVMVLFPAVVAGWPIFAAASSGLTAGCIVLGVLSVMAALTAQYTLHPEQRDNGDEHFAVGVAMVCAAIVLVATVAVLITVRCLQMDEFKLEAVALAICPALTVGLLLSLRCCNGK